MKTRYLEEFNHYELELILKALASKYSYKSLLKRTKIVSQISKELRLSMVEARILVEGTLFIKSKKAQKKIKNLSLFSC